MCATCSTFDVFVIVKIVFSPVREARSTSKYGSSSVAAGATPMSQLSSLFVVAGAPVGNVAFATTLSGRAANAEPATTSVANRAQTVSFFISISYTSNLISEYERRFGSPNRDDTITSVFSFAIRFMTNRADKFFELPENRPKYS